MAVTPLSRNRGAENNIRTRRPMLRRRIAATFLVLAASFASAYQHNTAVWTGTTGVNGSAATTYPGGATVTVTAGGANVEVLTVSGSHSASYGALSSSYTPNIGVTLPATRLGTFVRTCPITGGICANRGTITIAFGRPIRNPVLHIAGLGGAVGAPLSASIFRLTSSLPAGASIGTATGLNLTSTSTQFTTTSFAGINGGGNCTTGADTSGCGSVPIVGTVTSVTFTIDLNKQAGTYTNNEFDGYTLSFTASEDFGDAPASYDTGAAASHLVGDLTIGNNITVDNATVANGTTSPNASANATNDSDDFAAWPILTQGTAATVTVPLAGASQSGTLCGWVDFDNNGAFATPAERACQSFSAGATSVALSFAVPAGAVIGNRIARLRAVYGATLPGATGRLDSGEVEDAQVQVQAPTADLSITKTNTPGVGPSDQPADNVTSGTATIYSLRVVNAGPSAAVNALVTDTPGAGITCPGALGGTTVTCSATSSPAGATTCPAAGVLTTANLLGAGIAIPSLAVSPTPATPNNFITLTFTCTVN